MAVKILLRWVAWNLQVNVPAVDLGPIILRGARFLHD